MKPKALIDSGLVFTGLTTEQVGILLRRTTFTNPVFTAVKRHSPYGAPGANIPEHLEFSEPLSATSIRMMRGAYYLLPKEDRMFLRHEFHWTDKRNAVTVDFPDPKLEFNQEQVECLEALEDSLNRRTRPFGNIYYIASTAAGKTILQAATAARLRQRTLVICPTNLIMKAWEADLAKLFGFTSKQLGYIVQSKFRVGEHFTLASLSTIIRRRSRWEELNKLFGAVILDEVQVVSGPNIFEFMRQNSSAFHIAATATEETRLGGRNLHVRAVFGKPLKIVNVYGKGTQSSVNLSQVNVIETQFEYESQYDNTDWNDLGPDLYSDDDRNALIVENVKREWLEGRSVLVATKYLEHVDILKDALKKAGVTNVNEISGSTNSNRGYTTRLLDAVASRKVTCLVGTLRAIVIGANLPELDSVHVAMPPANKRDLLQLVGRVRRRTATKTDAMLTYYLDNKVGYLIHLYKKIAIPSFRELKVPGFENLIMT